MVAYRGRYIKFGWALHYIPFLLYILFILTYLFSAVEADDSVHVVARLVVDDWDFVVGLFVDLVDCLVAVPGFLGLVPCCLFVPVFVFFSYQLFQVIANLFVQPILQIQVRLLLLLMKLLQQLPAHQELHPGHSVILFFLRNR